jgi:hypothetical protein
MASTDGFYYYQMMNSSIQYLYAPGCALMCYKPELANRLKDWVERLYGPVILHTACCLNKKECMTESCVLTPCVTCYQQYKKLCPDSEPVFLLEKLLETDCFPFPDYHGMEMSIQDTCSARLDPKILSVVRQLLERMNIRLSEPLRSRNRSKCCGQKFYGKLPVEEVESLMAKRAGEMPCEEVVVYCASCITSMSVGGKRPRYLLDLLFGEKTDIFMLGAETWNSKLASFRIRNAKLQTSQ